jgi:hypothetical protein
MSTVEMLKKFPFGPLANIIKLFSRNLCPNFPLILTEDIADIGVITLKKVL